MTSATPDLEPQEWFQKLNAMFVMPTRRPWQDKHTRPTMFNGRVDTREYSDCSSRYTTPRNEFLDTLWSYNVGDPPLPQLQPEYHEVFRGVVRKARSNYAPMCIAPMLDRTELQDISTLVDNDTDGDDMAAEIIEETGFGAVSKEVFEYTFALGEGYAMAVPGTPDGPQLSNGQPMPSAHAIDPRRCIGIPDLNNPMRLRAALVHQVDPITEQRKAFLYLPGRKYPVLFNQGSGLWNWDGTFEEIKGLDALGGIPIVHFPNKSGLGEYEPHLDLLDRIIDTTLQRIIGFWYQALRQRGLIGDEDEENDQDTPLSESKEPVDLNKVLRAGPGELWQIPADFKIWESQQTDFGGILKGKRDDVQEFAALTGTPLHLVSPEAADGSAAGAGLLREALTSKCRDRRVRLEPRTKLLWRMLFAMAGDQQRARRIQVQWGPIDFHTLAEQASASSQAVGTLSLEDRCERIWDMSPDETKRNITRLTADRLIGLPTTPGTTPGSTQQQDTGAAPQNPPATAANDGTN